MSDESDFLAFSTVRSSLHGNDVAARVPCFTLLGHPDPSRIGERAALPALLADGVVEVDRGRPRFGPPGRPAMKPLADRHVSRSKSIRLSRADGALVLEAGEAKLRVAGEVVREVRRVAPEELERGLVLQLGDWVVLLLHESSQTPPTPVAGLLGQSEAIDQVRRDLLRVADLDTPVMLRGETGTGKELVAHSIHAASPRATHEMVSLNMATVAQSVAASILFGHARGSFTGAERRHRGVFERASGGTLLLDEIGETPLDVQPMLLRAVETQRVTPLGQEQECEVDVRLIAATDADLESESRSFNAALLHRLAGYELRLPALRDRREDIPLLLREFLRDELAAVGEQAQLAPMLHAVVRSGFLARLVVHPLPGNVRQLRNVARHLVISNRGATRPEVTEAAERQLRSEPPPPPGPEAAPGAAHPAQSSKGPADLSEDTLLEALRAHAWSPTRAAKSLGIPTGTLHGLMRRSSRLRRASDFSDAELRAAYAEHGGDLRRMADALHVSERALRLALRGRDFFES